MLYNLAMENSQRLPILVVDDDRSVLAVLQSWLEAQGWTPECHQDPLQALDAYSLRRHAAAVLDWSMPQLDGLELVRRLRAQNQAHSVYVLLVTSSDRTEILAQAFEEGVDDFLRKPLDKMEFVARMKAARRVCLLDNEIRLRSEHDLERRMHSLALQRVSALVGAVAHELRTPLASVKLAAERLRSRPDRVSNEALPILDRLDQGVSHLGDTLDDVLDTFGMSHRSPRWEPYRPSESVNDAIRFARDRTTSTIELVEDLEPGSETIQGTGDGVSVRRLVSNLLANAIRHTSSGTVRIHLGRLSGGFILVVEDTGEGISPELLPWLGEPLLLNSENVGFGHFIRGNGMGLSLCRRIVQRHGGTFTIRSLPGAGTRVTATLRLDLVEPHPTDVPDNFYTQSGAP
jgi:signal transduction histidine kinase